MHRLLKICIQDVEEQIAKMISGGSSDALSQRFRAAKLPKGTTPRETARNAGLKGRLADASKYLEFRAGREIGTAGGKPPNVGLSRPNPRRQGYFAGLKDPSVLLGNPRGSAGSIDGARKKDAERLYRAQFGVAPDRKSYNYLDEFAEPEKPSFAAAREGRLPKAEQRKRGSDTVLRQLRQIRETPSPGGGSLSNYVEPRQTLSPEDQAALGLGFTVGDRRRWERAFLERHFPKGQFKKRRLIPY